MLKKIILSVLIIIMLAMMVLVVGLAFINKDKDLLPQKPDNKIEETEIARTDYNAVARKTLDWIDQQRNDEGWYILERGCDFNKKVCDTVWDNQEGNKDGLIATWARFNFYNQTKDPSDLEIVKNDINKFYKKYPNGVDNALWICKITYDMWKSEVFDQSTKDKLENICFGSKFEKRVTDAVEYEKEFTKGLGLVDKNKQIWETWQGYSFAIRGVDNYFGITSDLISQYLWTKDESKLDLAKKYFESAKNIVNNSGSSFIENKCLLGLSSLDIYIVNKQESDYFKYAENLYNTLIVGSDDTRRVITPICGLFVKNLHKITEGQSYLKNLEFFSDILVKFNSDSSVNKIVGDYGFYLSDKGLLFVWFKDVVENGLVVELLRD